MIPFSRFKNAFLSMVFGAVLFVSLGNFTLAEDSSNPAAPQASAPVELDQWDSVLEPQKASKIKMPTIRLSNTIFDLFDDLNFLKIMFGSNDQFYVKSQRKVFDNQDILNSWTVVDRLQLNNSLGVFSTTIGSSPIGFSIGTTQSVDLVNIRQVLPAGFSKVKSLAQRELEVQEAVAAASGTEGVIETSGGMLSSQDPQDQARFGKIWNRVAFPLRLPLTREALKNLDDGEIMSYAGEGAVQLGASVGWNTSVVGLGDGSASVGLTTYVRGVYRIAVLKESDRYVRVKLFRLGAMGESASAGVRFDQNFLSGYWVVRAAGRFLKVVPFELSATAEQSRSFDVGYRYDLTNPAARDAYEQAVLGRFAASDDLAISPEGEVINASVSGVQKIFNRETHGDSQQVTQHMQLSFIIRRDHTTSYQNLESVVTFPDGTFRTFKSWSENSWQWASFWSFFEKFQYRFTVNLDLNHPAQTGGMPKYPMSLWAQGNIEDSTTTGGELLSYILESENAVGKVGVFPRPPSARAQLLASTSAAPGSEARALPIKGYARSSFFYQIAFKPEQVESLIQTSDNKAWEILEKAFLVSSGSWTNPIVRAWKRFTGELVNILTYPLYLADLPLRYGNVQGHAARIHSRWMAVKDGFDERDTASRLGKMFYDRRYSFELVKLLRGAMNGQPAAYQLSAYSPVFGRVMDSGESTVFIDDLATRAQREVEFDREAGRVPEQNRSAWIEDFKTRVLGASRVKLSMSLREAPKALYLELFEKTLWGLSTTKVGSVIVYNTGDFPVGANVVVLDAADQQSPWYSVAKSLKPGTRYMIRMAINPSGLNWGPAVQAEFRTP